MAEFVESPEAGQPVEAAAALSPADKVRLKTLRMQALVVAFLVFVFDQPIGYLAGVFLDGSVGIATLFCLLRILRLEQNIAEGRQA